MYIDAANDYTVPTFWQFNIYGTYKIGKCLLSAHINNITNRDNLQNGVLTNTSKARYMVDAPTSLFVQAKYYF